MYYVVDKEGITEYSDQKKTIQRVESLTSNGHEPELITVIKGKKIDFILNKVSFNTRTRERKTKKDKKEASK